MKVLTTESGCVVFSPDGKRLASSNSTFLNNTSPPPGSGVKVWDAQTSDELLTLTGHSGPVHSVAFSPDGKRLVSGAGQVKVWDVFTGQELLTLDGRGEPSNSLAFSPDGNHLVGTGQDRTVEIWDATPLSEKP